ncbi:MAG: ATP-binding cassette domain-containing protein [Treponema sp.]|nr:ATP-binding cassette domain-containing protein [Treponema sp.]
MKITNLTIKIKERILFEQLNLELKGITGIFAPTGSGKTTLLNYIAGNLKNKTEFEISGTKDFDENINISYGYQDFRLLENLSVEKNILLPLENLSDYEEKKNNALEIAEKLKLTDLLSEKCKDLSGGEKQRVSLVRAFAFPGDLLLLDEPFSNQDEEKCNLIIEQIKIMAEKVPVLVVSHNREFLDLLTDKLLYI